MSQSPLPGPLTGVRIIDLTWLLVGAGATRLLATLGAEVIRIEAPADGRQDAMRLRPPYMFEQRGYQADPEEVVLPRAEQLDRASHFFNINPGKRGITLNMNHPKGQKLFARLVALGDVVTENFSAHQMERWGFGYDRLRQIKNDIIYVQMSGLGYRGRDNAYISFGPTAQALSGLSYQSGLPEPYPPAGWGLSYLDHSGAYYGAMAVLCGLYHRQRTGRGQHIDMSQVGVGLNLTGTAILDFIVNQRPTSRSGNRSPYRLAAPHGAYPCQGEDRWCAIAVFTEEEWQHLCEAMGFPDWTREARFTTLAERLRHQNALDAHLAAWTRQHEASALQRLLRQHGVRAARVQTARDKIEDDPQLQHRGYITQVEHAKLGQQPVENHPWKFSLTPANVGGPINRGAPCLGQDNQYVYGELLGLSATELAQYAAEGVI
jgi:crotonobetainyl-CoA:carnitine CoA-transferase CaiB-like acyl-CoA transferase